jgi:hypothetical protein
VLGKGVLVITGKQEYRVLQVFLALGMGGG